MEFLTPAPPPGKTPPPLVWPHRTIAISMIVGALMISCSSYKKEGVSQPTWETPFQQWQSLNPHNYTIDQRRTCFCPGGGELVQITIRNDTIARIIRISDTSVVTYPFYLTVDSLFKIIRFNKADSMAIRYNSHYGYPEYLDLDPQLHPVDGGVLYETSNLQIR
jgi:uncharacterized protein DUF6174